MLFKYGLTILYDVWIQISRAMMNRGGTIGICARAKMSLALFG